MKIVITAIIAVLLAAVTFWAIDVDVDGNVELPEVSGDMNLTGGELPDVDVDVTGNFEMPKIDPDVNVTGGNLPEVDVDTVDVDVNMEETEVEVPTVEIEKKKMSIGIPNIDIDSPEENTVAEDNDL